MADAYGCGSGYGCNSGCGYDSEIGNLCRYIGQTVTIFTTGGGVAGCGFTGVLMSANECYVRLLTCIGSAPACPIGSNCCDCDTCATGKYNPCGGRGCGNDCGNGYYGNSGYRVGSTVVIPVDQIVSFCTNAI